MAAQNKEQNNEVKSANDYVEKAEWYRSEYFINPDTGDIYDCYRPNIYRCVKGLDRFIEAQNHHNAYQIALKEIRSGKKKTHWVWFVFPQMAGLGKSEKSIFYGISHRGEAYDYIANPTLRARLIEATEAAYYNEKTVYEIFGHDAIKVACCMKLFASVSDIPIFKQMLKKYCWR